MMARHGEFTGFREISRRHQTMLPGLRSLPLVVAAAVTLFGLAGAGLLWTYVGTAIFFETIRNGFAVCFG